MLDRQLAECMGHTVFRVCRGLKRAPLPLSRHEVDKRSCSQKIILINRVIPMIIRTVQW
jgi:hypothetical protein